MNLIEYLDAQAFLNQSEETLLADETEHNLILGLAGNLLKSDRPGERPLFVSIEDGGKLVGFALRGEQGRPLVLSKMPSAATQALAQGLSEKAILLDGCVGPSGVSELFSGQWVKKTGLKSKLMMHLGLYELERVERSLRDLGDLSPISNDDRELVLEYLLRFSEECFPDEKDPRSRALEMTDHYLRSRDLYLLRTPAGSRVSIAAKARETRNGATISSVYTPPELRGRGYGSFLVAALSSRLLAQGKRFCNLFTDLRNPTSNSIYMKIGYRKVGESKHFSFR